jgi:hypothetical protein
MIAYKLFRQRKNGTLGPLFINQRQQLEPGISYSAEAHRTKGFAFRPGWHCTLKPHAPHLTEKNRVWARVEIDDFTLYQRPAHQGGTWALANTMKILEVL